MNNNNNHKRHLKGTTIIVTDNMPFNVAMRKFKQKVNDSGILEEVKSRGFYEKPTTVRKRKKGAARARHLKKLRDSSMPKKLY